MKLVGECAVKLVGECAVGLVAVKPAATHEHTRTTADIAATRRVRSVRVSAAYADLSMGACGCSEQAGATHRVLGLIRRKRDAGSTIRFGRFRAIQPVAPAPIVSGMKRDRRSECAVAGQRLVGHGRPQERTKCHPLLVPPRSLGARPLHAVT